MGDHGKLYVSKELVDVYRNVVVPSAQFVIPNQFEAELVKIEYYLVQITNPTNPRLLTDVEIKCEADAIRACDILHDKGVEVVVITSLYYNDEEIVLLGSSRKENDKCRFALCMPALPHYYTGTGDLFGALLLGWSLKHPTDLKLVCEKAVSGIRSVILNTAKHYKHSTATHPELRIIQSRTEIENPTISLTAKNLPL